MIRRHFSFAILLLVLGLALAGCGGDDNESSGTTAATTEASAGDTGSDTTGASATTLNGSVGPGFDISLDGTDGITAGDYTLVVNDQSTAHNFHLTGPGGRRRLDGGLGGGRKDVRCDSGRGRVQVPVRPARELDERQLHRGVVAGRAARPSSRIRSLPIFALVTMNTTLKIVATVSVLAHAAAAAAVLLPKR